MAVVGDVGARTDAELVVAACEGDAGAQARLYERHFAGVLAACRGRVRCAQTSQDLAQEAWTRGLERLDQLRDPARFAGWVHAIARRLCIDELQARSRRDDGPIPELADGRVDVDGAFQQTATVDAVQAVLADLDKDDRVVLVLREFEGWDFDSIGERFGVSAGAARVRAHRARRRLRDLCDAASLRPSVVWLVGARAWRRRRQAVRGWLRDGAGSSWTHAVVVAAVTTVLTVLPGAGGQPGSDAQGQPAVGVDEDAPVVTEVIDLAWRSRSVPAGITSDASGPDPRPGVDAGPERPAVVLEVEGVEVSVTDRRPDGITVAGAHTQVVVAGYDRSASAQIGVLEDEAIDGCPRLHVEDGVHAGPGPTEVAVRVQAATPCA